MGILQETTISLWENQGKIHGVLGRAARLLIHKEPIGKAVELLCTLIRTDTTPVQLVTLLRSPHDFVVLKRGPGSRLLRRLASDARLLLGSTSLKI